MKKSAPTKKYPKYLSLLLLIIAVITISFYFIKKQTSSPQSLQKVRVRHAWLNQAQFAGTFVAIEKGFYKKYGLEVEALPFVFENDQHEELANGGVDFTVSSATEFLIAKSQNLPITAVAVIYQDSPYAFASLQSKNIKSPADFRGKVLGSEGGNKQAELTYDVLLRQYEINDKEVTFKNLNFDELNDLRQNRADVIDLYRTDQPYLFEKENIEINLMYPEKFGFPQYGDTLVTTQALIDKNPKLVKGFVNATLEGWEYALKYPDEAVQIILKYDDESYHSEERERYILNNSIPLIKPVGGNRIGDMEFLKWRRSYSAMVEAGIIEDNAFDIEKAYTTQFIH